MLLLWLFLACGSSAHEDWTWSWCSCLAHGDPGGAKSAGTLTASATGAMALSESSPSLCQLAIRRPLWLVFLCCSVHSSTWRAPWWRSYSFVQWVRCLKGQPLCCSAASAGKWVKRGYSDGSTLYGSLSSIVLPPRLPGFPSQAFLSQYTPSQYTPLRPSCLSQQQILPWDCYTIPMLQLPATVPSRGLGPCPQYGWLQQEFSLWFSFCLYCHRSVASLSASNASPLSQIIAPMWESDPCSFSPSAKGWSSPINSPLSPPSFFVLLSFAWFYIFVSGGQVLLPALSWCSATCSVSEVLFLMYLWRKMYSMSIYCTALLFCLHSYCYCLVAESCLTLCDPKDCSPTISVPGIY